MQQCLRQRRGGGHPRSTHARIDPWNGHSPVVYRGAIVEQTGPGTPHDVIGVADGPDVVGELTLVLDSHSVDGHLAVQV